MTTILFVCTGNTCRSPMAECMMRALLAGRDYIIPEDVQHMALPVLSHRLVLSPESRMKGVTAQSVVMKVLKSVPVPVKL